MGSSHTIIKLEGSLGYTTKIPSIKHYLIHGNGTDNMLGKSYKYFVNINFVHSIAVVHEFLKSEVFMS